MRFCITGYGSIAAVHRDALLPMEGVAIDSVVGRLIEPTREFADGCGAPLATLDLGEALARPGVDAVLITSPSQVHYAQARAALEADKHVLLEIPMALSYAEAAALCDLADARGKTLMICHTERFWASTMRVEAADRRRRANALPHPRRMALLPAREHQLDGPDDAVGRTTSCGITAVMPLTMRSGCSARRRWRRERSSARRITRWVFPSMSQRKCGFRAAAWRRWPSATTPLCPRPCSATPSSPRRISSSMTPAASPTATATCCRRRRTKTPCRGKTRSSSTPSERGASR